MWNRQPNHVAVWPNVNTEKLENPYRKPSKLIMIRKAFRFQFADQINSCKIHIQVTHIELNEMERVTDNG